MTDEENMIFKDAFHFFKAHSDPPPVTVSEAWWEKTINDMFVLEHLCGNHPLMGKLLAAIYEYIELKAKEGKP